jgi:hypothetical protein
MSKTTLPERSALAATGDSPGKAPEPSGVAFTSTSYGTRPSSSNPPALAALVAAATSRACSARRASTATRAPARTSANAAALAAPPAPRMTTLRPAGSMRRRSGTSTPSPSVLKPTSRPSCATTVFAEPASADCGVTESRWPRMAPL